MKKNVAQIVFNGVDKNALTEVLVAYLPETVLEGLVYHFSGDVPLHFTLPEYDEEKVLAYVKDRRSTRENVKVNNIVLDIPNQRAEIYYGYDTTKFYKTAEDAANDKWPRQDEMTEEYTYPAIRRCSDSTYVDMKEFIVKFKKD